VSAGQKTIELLACPFCGKPAEMIEDEYWRTTWIGCTDKPKHKDGPCCNARTVADHRADAVSQWNRRVV
jgi:hypothetical protein